MFRNIFFVFVMFYVLLGVVGASAEATVNNADVALIAGQIARLNATVAELQNARKEPPSELAYLQARFTTLKDVCKALDLTACGNNASSFKTGVGARPGLSNQAKADLAAALNAFREGIKSDVAAVVIPQFEKLETSVAGVKADTEEIKSLVRKPRASDPCNETLTLLPEANRTKEELVQSQRCLGDGRKGRNEIALAAIKRGAGITIVGESIFVDEKFEDPNWSIGTSAAIGFLGGFAGGVGYVAAYDGNRRTDDKVHFGPYVETGLVSGVVGAGVGVLIALAQNVIVD